MGDARTVLPPLMGALMNGAVNDIGHIVKGGGVADYDLVGGNVSIGKDGLMTHNAKNGKHKHTKAMSHAVAYYLAVHPKGNARIKQALAGTQMEGAGFFSKIKGAFNSLKDKYGQVIKNTAVDLIKKHGAEIGKTALAGFTGGGVDQFIDGGVANSWTDFLQDNAGEFKGRGKGHGWVADAAAEYEKVADQYRTHRKTAQQLLAETEGGVANDWTDFLHNTAGTYKGLGKGKEWVSDAAGAWREAKDTGAYEGTDDFVGTDDAPHYRRPSKSKAIEGGVANDWTDFLHATKGTYRGKTEPLTAAAEDWASMKKAGTASKSETHFRHPSGPKRKPSEWNLFVKEHMPAEYKRVVASGVKGREASAQALRNLSAAYKEQGASSKSGGGSRYGGNIGTEEFF